MLDEKWNQWRTSTVTAICQRIRQTGDYSALPILADALEDAGCDDAEALTQLRSSVEPTQALRLVCLIHGGEPAEAVAWMDKFLEEFTDGWYEDENGEYVDVYEDESRRTAPGVRYHEEHRLSYDDLMEAAQGYLKNDEYYCLPFDTPDTAYKAATAKLFWKHYEAITGVKAKGKSLFFHCAC